MKITRKQLEMLIEDKVERYILSILKEEDEQQLEHRIHENMMWYVMHRFRDNFRDFTYSKHPKPLTYINTDFIPNIGYRDNLVEHLMKTKKNRL